MPPRNANAIPARLPAKTTNFMNHQEITKAALELCYQIEKCGASEELTKASVMASSLHMALSTPHPANAPQDTGKCSVCGQDFATCPHTFHDQTVAPQDTTAKGEDAVLDIVTDVLARNAETECDRDVAKAILRSIRSVPASTEDSQLLDWLESHCHKFRDETEDSVAHAEVTVCMRIGQPLPTPHSLRAAIRAAMVRTPKE